jgi:peroxiredoxin
LGSSGAETELVRLKVNDPSVFRYYKGVRLVGEKSAVPPGLESFLSVAPALKRSILARQNRARWGSRRWATFVRPYRAGAGRVPAVRVAACLALGLLAALIGCYSGNHPARIGSNAPDFTVQDSDHKVTLSQFRGQVVLLNFWATWCPPCIEETPSLVRMQARFKDKGVVVLAVSIDADDAAYHKFLKEYSVNMVTVRDESQKTPTLYGTFGWPETYVIDRSGVIRRKFIGAVDWTSPEITDYLSKL